MAILFNNVGAAVAGGAAVTLLTVPAGAEAMALELKFTPVGGTANLTLTLERQATGVPFNFVTNHAIAAGDIFDFGKIALQEGDILSFSATGNNINGLVSYYQDGSATTSAGSLNPRGEYSAPATFNRLDVVSYGGISYIQLNDGISGDAPPSANWMINAAPTTHTHPIGEVAGLQGALDGKSALNSPTFIGTPSAPTPAAEDNSTKLATTAYVERAAGAVSPTFATKQEAEAGTNPNKSMSPLRVAEAIAALAESGGASGLEVFTSSGTWAPDPAGSYLIIATGGGSGGSGGYSRIANSSGVTAFKFISSPHSSYSVNIGAGGAGAPGSGSGSNGGNTTVESAQDGSTPVLAYGGSPNGAATGGFGDFLCAGGMSAMGVNSGSPAGAASFWGSGAPAGSGGVGAFGSSGGYANNGAGAYGQSGVVVILRLS